MEFLGGLFSLVLQTPTPVVVTNPPDLAPVVEAIEFLHDAVIALGWLAAVTVAATVATLFAVVVGYFK